MKILLAILVSSALSISIGVLLGLYLPLIIATPLSFGIGFILGVGAMVWALQ